MELREKQYVLYDSRTGEDLEVCESRAVALAHQRVYEVNGEWQTRIRTQIVD